MATDTQTPETPSSVEGAAAFAKMIGAAVAQANSEANPRKMTFGEYQRRLAKGRSVLRRPFFENGALIPATQLTNAEIDLLNQITHTGRYLDRNIEVILRNENLDESVEVRYNNATHDQQNVIYRLVRSFEDMLTQIVTAQKAEDAELEEQAMDKATRPRRSFGDTKAFRDAKQANG